MANLQARSATEDRRTRAELMRTLTEVFAPGAPSLPEGLRTLVVSPDRTVEPGTTVRATFAFYNFGGAAATGLRVRLALPDGLRYVPGSARVDDRALDARRDLADVGPVGTEQARLAANVVERPVVDPRTSGYVPEAVGERQADTQTGRGSAAEVVERKRSTDGRSRFDRPVRRNDERS